MTPTLARRLMFFSSFACVILLAFDWIESSKVVELQDCLLGTTTTNDASVLLLNEPYTVPKMSTDDEAHYAHESMPDLRLSCSKAGAFIVSVCGLVIVAIISRKSGSISRASG